MQYILLKSILTFLTIFIPNSNINLKSGSDISEFQNSSVKLNIHELYNELQIKDIPLNVFELAYTGYCKLKAQNALTHPDILTIIDYSKSSTVKRLFVVDLSSKKLIFNELVAHGMNTGADYARYFSNKCHSNQSSLGFFVTGEPYEGKNGYSLKLLGLEKEFNSKAMERGVVMHGANYVSENYIRQNGRLGRSFGCTAVSREVNFDLIQAIKGGSCLFIYYPDKNYLSKSEFLANAEQNIKKGELF